MQLHYTFVALLAIVQISGHGVIAAMIPKPVQTHFRLDAPLDPHGQSMESKTSGLRFYRRKATASGGRKHPAHVDDRLPDAAYIPKAKRAAWDSATEGVKDNTRTLIGKHARRHSFRRHALARRFSASLANRADAGVPGMAGRIDIMSPSVDNPMGERIASLSISTEPTEENQFTLSASGVNATNVYLVVKNSSPMQDGTVAVTLQVPVFDQEQAAFVSYCATFDTTQASPLTAAECNPQEMTDHSSQLFSYNSSSGVIRPLWLTSAPLLEKVWPPVSKEEEVAADGPGQSGESDPSEPPAEPSDSTNPVRDDISLVFTQESDSSTPVVNAQSSGNDIDVDVNSPTPSSTRTSSSADDIIAQDTSGSDHQPTAPTPTAENAEVESTMCGGSHTTPTPALSAAAVNNGTGSEETEVSSMTDESASASASTLSAEAVAPSHSAVMKRQDFGTGVDEDEENDGMDGEGDQDLSEEPVVEGTDDETKRKVHTPVYLWRFRSS
ncbi:hypothetical protein M408DRAFT_325694 [Serendipita vermifera MAFF 305830]|uniref:Uncharacterized protein n=1 Tax=Serendipita vermifera MAFF 305830 TaxID=933852 RepID=A0A0C2X851_SERVB|nr:hypothetical protein M408DRAFT_325694 [Serendipita vermifera MAFF 305830]